MSLTPQQRLFVASYEGNATAAAKAAGYSARTADRQGSRLLKNAEVSAAIATKLERRVAKLELTAERIDAERARCALYDPRKVYGPDGRLLKLHELDEDTARAISSVKFVTVTDEDGKVLEIAPTEYKFTPKDAHLTAADRVLGRAKDRVEHELGAGLGELIAEATRRREEAARKAQWQGGQGGGK